MSTIINGLFLRDDWTELITEKFSDKYSVNLTNWIIPYGYFNQYDGTITCNDFIPDGTYILLGKVSYPGKGRYSYHTVCQFNLCKSSGIDLIFLKPFHTYTDLPKEIPLAPKFPLFRVGDTKEYKKIYKLFLQVSNEYLTERELNSKLTKLDKNTIEYKIYALRLALLNFLMTEM